ncbi:hypothetical protein [Weissella halotolerans]|uniref:Uncharacterized protein n=1 Tax=Weissella halotolerans DSM 20190 TaxID=1123500 RepID=A0A0R2G1R9_9LACO|nr:hypothetical protein [Weissella halotolerans]KRN33414.1 hypothetical protein IV68_GL000212 [Weissella halotolerans DSM 20190]
MNNLRTLRDFFQLPLLEVSQSMKLAPEVLTAFEDGLKEPSIHQWQQLAELYAQYFHVAAQPANELPEPIHFRLSIDYLMNIGLTMNDLLAMQWYFAQTRPEIGRFGIMLLNPNDHLDIVRVTLDLATVLTEYAGFLLLNHDGSLNQFIDEAHANQVSDWRLVLYQDNQHFLDISDLLLYLPDLPNVSQFQ